MARPAPPLADGLALAFPAEATLGQLHRFFGLPAPTWSTTPLQDLVAEGPARLGPFVVSPDDDPELVRLVHEPQNEPAEPEPTEPEPIELPSPAPEPPADGADRPDDAA